MSVAVLCLPALLLAQQADSNQITPEEFMAKLAPRSGTVVISNGLATLQVPPTFRYMWVGILAFKKLIVAAVAAVGVWMRRVFGKKDSPQASAPPPTTA
jgi:hypothetical protein